MSPVLSLTDLFQKNNDKVLFHSLNDELFTYGVLWENAFRLAQVWRSEGLEPGQVVAITIPNGIAGPCCYLACAIGGFIACPIPNSHHPETIERLLSVVKPSKVLRDPPAIIAKKNSKNNYENVFINMGAPFLILFTSGLTGEPKAMRHNLKSILGSAESFARLTNMDGNTRLLHVLPMAYMAGILNAFFAPMMAGATIIEGSLFSPAAIAGFWDAPMRLHVNTLSITPTIASALCRATRDANIIEWARTNLTQVQCTSAPINENLRRQFLEMFGLPLQNCYGMTEIGGPLTFQTLMDARQHHDFGETLDAIDCSMRGDNGNELWIKSPFAMEGYIVDGKIVSVADENGYIDTGDIATLDQGKLQINGRKKDIIIRGGINISPAHVEAVLAQASGADEVAVLGVDHEFWGEIIVACVIPKSGFDNVRNNVLIQARNHLSIHERPDRVVLLESFPRSFIGKLQRNILKQQLLDRNLI